MNSHTICFLKVTFLRVLNSLQFYPINQIPVLIFNVADPGWALSFFSLASETRGEDLDITLTIIPHHILVSLSNEGTRSPDLVALSSSPTTINSC